MKNLHLRWRSDDGRIQREAGKLPCLKIWLRLKQYESRKKKKKHTKIGLCDSLQEIMILQDQIKSFLDGWICRNHSPALDKKVAFHISESISEWVFCKQAFAKLK